MRVLLLLNSLIVSDERGFCSLNTEERKRPGGAHAPPSAMHENEQARDAVAQGNTEAAGERSCTRCLRHLPMPSARVACWRHAVGAHICTASAWDASVSLPLTSSDCVAASVCARSRPGDDEDLRDASVRVSIQASRHAVHAATETPPKLQRECCACPATFPCAAAANRQDASSDRAICAAVFVALLSAQYWRQRGAQARRTSVHRWQQLTKTRVWRHEMARQRTSEIGTRS